MAGVHLWVLQLAMCDSVQSSHVEFLMFVWNAKVKKVFLVLSCQWNLVVGTDVCCKVPKLIEQTKKFEDFQAATVVCGLPEWLSKVGLAWHLVGGGNLLIKNLVSKIVFNSSVFVLKSPRLVASKTWIYGCGMGKLTKCLPKSLGQIQGAKLPLFVLILVFFIMLA